MNLLEISFSTIFNTHQIIEWAIIYIETGFFLGLILPGGDYMLFVTGIFCGTNFIDIHLIWVILMLITAAFLGYLTGILKVNGWEESYLPITNRVSLSSNILKKGKDFYDKYGIWAFVLGRFMPIVRTLVHMIAGASSVPYKKFILFNFLGSIVWIGTLVPLGYYIGNAYPDVLKYSVFILIGFVGIASFPMIKIMISKIKKS